MKTNNDRTTLHVKKEYGDTLLECIRRYKARVEYEKNKELEWKIEDYLSYWVCYGNNYNNILETIIPLLKTVKRDDMKQFLLDRFNSILIDNEIEIGDIIVKIDDMDYVKKTLVPYIIEKIIDALYAENNKVKRIIY